MWLIKMMRPACQRLEYSITQRVTTRRDFVSIVEIMLRRASSEISLIYRRYLAHVRGYGICIFKAIVGCNQLLQATESGKK